MEVMALHDAPGRLQTENIWFSNNVASKIHFRWQDRHQRPGRSATSKVPDFKGNAASGGTGSSGNAAGNSFGSISNMNGTGPETRLGRLDPADRKVEIFTTPKGMTEVTQVATSMDCDRQGQGLG